MTVKVALLKSGEQVIADIKEMIIGKEEESRVVGYFFEYPYVVHLRNPELVMDKPDENSGFQLEISLFTWSPLSKDHIIPISADWVVTMVEPIKKLKDMYETLTDRIKLGDDDKDGPTNDQSSSSDKQSDTDISN